jgi:very-short-patch-repair endonuclease
MQMVWSWLLNSTND